ncbi:MAG: hypothetical protein CFE46_17810 [Burkholderiales bacterium PBB6]|nr:MAG: hypothetical protein CFE46_17810 [Burkholderiales bacterium PBB6]
MRFLFFILDGWPTFRPDVSALWGRHLLTHDVHADLVTQATTADHQDQPWPAGRAWLVAPGGSKMAELLKTFAHDCKMLWRLRRDPYDAVIVRDKAFITVFALLWARLRGLPFIYWMSFPMAESLVRLRETLDKRQWVRRAYLGWRGHVGGWLLHRVVLPRAHHIFVQSDRMKEDMVLLGLKAERMTPVPMCVDLDRFKAPLPFVERNDGRRVIGYLGESSRVRRVDFLFEVVAIIKRSMPEVLLLIVGDALDDADRQWLADRIAELGVQDHVQITGWIPSDQVAEVFGQAEVALALVAPDPLLDAASPTKLVEYLAMGRPVVGNQHPDQNLVLSASGAGLCVAFDATAFASAVLQLLNDKAACSLMAARGREWVVSNRSYDVCAASLAKRLAEVVR